MKILSSFTHRHDFLNLQTGFFYLFSTKEYILKNVGNQIVDGIHLLS